MDLRLRLLRFRLLRVARPRLRQPKTEECPSFSFRILMKEEELTLTAPWWRMGYAVL